MRRLVLAAFLLCIGTSVSAQTTVRTLGWIQGPENVTPVDPPAQVLAKAQAYSYTTKVDTLPAEVSTQTCALVGTAVNCSAPLSSAALAQMALAGPHTITLTAINGFGSGVGTLTGASATAPITITIIVKVTIP